MDSIKALPLEIIIHIVEWMGLMDALELCNALGISTGLAYQYAIPLQSKHNGIDDFYDDLYEMEEIKDNLSFLFKNKRFNVEYSLSQKLQISVVLQCANVVGLLLKENEISDLNSVFGRGHLARCNAEIAKIFLADSRYKLFYSGNYDLRLAIKNGNLPIVELLLKDDRVDPSLSSNEAIIQASRIGNLHVVELLLKDDRVDPSDQDNDAVITAVRNGNLQVVELLLKDDRVDPSDQANEAIEHASRIGNLQIVKLLLKDDRVNPASRRNRAINIASAAGHLEIVQLLLSDSRVLEKGNKSRLIYK